MGLSENKIESTDVFVIGAGPAGSMAALAAASGGLDVVLAERDYSVGNPVRCAEAVDHKGLSRFFEPDRRWISSEISGYFLVAPDGTEVEMDTGFDKGYVLERLIFDRMIAEKAAAAGAKVLLGADVTGMTGYGNGFRTVTLKTAEKESRIRAKIVIAADGVESRAARWAGLESRVLSHDMEACAQYLLSGVNCRQDAFYLYFTSEFAPGGYAWVFPKGSGTANVGLGISGDFTGKKRPVEFLERFVERYFPGCSAVTRTLGGVPCTGGVEKIFADGFMAAGDAIHAANPITGGGIINAMISGQFAGETAVATVRGGDVSERKLSPYQKLCDEAFGKMNRRFYKLKEGIFNIPDSRLNDMAREMNALPLSKRTPVRVLSSALIRNPALLSVLARVIF